MDIANENVVKCTNCGCHPERSVSTMMNAAARRIIASGALTPHIERVPQHIRERVSPHPVWNFGFDDFMGAAENDILLGRLLCAVATNPSIWAEKDVEVFNNADIRLFQADVVMTRKDIFMFLHEIGGDHILRQRLGEGLDRLVDAVIARCADLTPAT